jgi:hypothetical protein
MRPLRLAPLFSVQAQHKKARSCGPGFDEKHRGGIIPPLCGDYSRQTDKSISTTVYHMNGAVAKGGEHGLRFLGFIILQCT